MKNLRYYIYAGLGLFALSSCSDFLDQTSPSEIDTETVFENTYYTELALNKVYGGLTEDDSYSQFMPIIAGLNTDCELVDGLGSNATNTTHNRGAMNYNVSPSWSDLADVWDTMYEIIENANQVVAGIDNSSLIQTSGSDRETMLRFRSEAVTLRSMVYFDLLRLFGDIPFSTAPTSSDLSNAYLEKTDRDDIMDSLIVDLEAAIEYLPWAGEESYTTEHVTKGYAHGLLANIALTRAGYAIREAAKDGYVTGDNSDDTYPTQRCDDATRKEYYELAEVHLAAIINSGMHALNTDLEEYWRLMNICELETGTPDNLFEIPMGLNSSGELGYTVGYRVNGATGSSLFGSYGNSTGKLKLTAPYYMSFADGDIRRDLTCAISQLSTSSSDGNLCREHMLGNAPFALYCCKWDYRKMQENAAWYSTVLATDAKLYTGINVVKMRYAQVLLMYAEVINELYGEDSSSSYCSLTAKEALKAVHDRAFTDETKREAAWEDLMDEDFFDAIVDENAWELAGEGFRKFDLIRWNLLSEKIDEFKETYTNAVYNGTYYRYVFYQYKSDNLYIDMDNLQFSNSSSMSGYSRASWFGASLTSSSMLTQLEVNLPSISSGLNSPVKNRYLLPICSTTISTSNGRLYNSYGFNN